MIVLPFIIGIYLTIQTNMPPESKNLIQVQGIAQIDTGNHYELRKANSKTPLSSSEILAIAGKLKAKKLNQKVSIKELKKDQIKTLTNKDGEFTFHLIPGIYTFFIIKKDKAYLNRFDGHGYFKSTKVEKPINDLILIDDEESLN